MGGSIEVDLVSRGDPHEIMERLVRFAAQSVEVDRCTLTSPIAAKATPRSSAPVHLLATSSPSAIASTPRAPDARIRRPRSSTSRIYTSDPTP